MNKSLAGRGAEELAVAYLRRQGYEVLERNVRMRFGEIDVVARDGPTLCFIEIRSRSSDRFGLPEESINREKRRRLVRLAEGYLQRPSAMLRAGLREPAGPVRFDVLSILLGADGAPARTRLIKGAFDADGI